MEIEFDEAKRQKALAERGLDFLDASKVFAGRHFQIEDDRKPYREVRFQTFGLIDGRMVLVVWTPTTAGRRIISMRKCNEREQARFEARLG